MTPASLRARLLLLASAAAGCRSEAIRSEPVASASAPSAPSAPAALPRPAEDLRPLTEPPPSPISGMCARTHCQPELPRVPSPHYPAPFERCAPVPSPAGPPQADSFSPRLTAEHRALTPGVCCYQSWNSCGGPHGGRPLRVGATRRQAARRHGAGGWS